jgi:GntR family transcriptional regulator
MKSEVRLEVLRRQRVPAVRRVRDILRSAILAGEYADGLLPGEQPLTMQFGVSRGVIRDVLALLRDEGLIQRLQGAGTFVVTPALSCRNIDTLDSRLDANTDHTRMYRDIMSVEQVPAPAYVAMRLGIAEGDPVVYHERVNMLDGRPATLRSGWMPEDVGLRLIAHHDQLQAPVLYVIEKVLGCSVATGELKVKAAAADTATAGALDVAPGAPLVLIERLFRDDDGRAVELSFSRMRGDRLYLSAVLRREEVGL